MTMEHSLWKKAIESDYLDGLVSFGYSLRAEPYVALEAAARARQWKTVREIVPTLPSNRRTRELLHSIPGRKPSSSSRAPARIALTVTVPRSLRADLVEEASRSGRSVSTLVEEAIDHFLNR